MSTESKGTEKFKHMYDLEFKQIMLTKKKRASFLFELFQMVVPTVNPQHHHQPLKSGVVHKPLLQHW